MAKGRSKRMRVLISPSQSQPVTDTSLLRKFSLADLEEHVKCDSTRDIPTSNSCSRGGFPESRHRSDRQESKKFKTLQSCRARTDVSIDKRCKRDFSALLSAHISCTSILISPCIPRQDGRGHFVQHGGLV